MSGQRLSSTSCDNLTEETKLYIFKKIIETKLTFLKTIIINLILILNIRIKM